MTIGRIPSVEGGIQPTIFDAKADILTATAADTPARLAVGANDTVLTADSSTATGLKWATPGGMTLLSTTTLTTGSTTTTISNISQDYTNLIIYIRGLYTATADSSVDLRFNSNSGSNYYRGMIRALGSTLAGVNDTITSAQIIDRTQTASTASLLAYAVATVYRYTQTEGKFIQSVGRSASSTTPVTQTNTHYFDVTDAITSVSVLTQYNVSGGVVYIYGVK